MIRQLVPTDKTITLDGLSTWCGKRNIAAIPFSDERIALAVALGRCLAAAPEARRIPALQALAFWMRKVEILRLRDEFQRATSESIVRVPRGTVLHFPPTNVDTIFVYSWLLAMLAGNRNIIRLSTRAGTDATLLTRLLNAALAEISGPLTDETIICTYDRDEQITRTLSAHCDARVIWGGDASVASIRQVPISPRCVELAFPDRYSFAALKADVVLALSQTNLEDLAERFFNDTYWFDQLGCSSPRIVAWIGTTDIANAAATRFWPAVRQCIVARGYEVDVGTALAKWTFANRAALDQTASEVGWESNELTIVSLNGLDRLTRVHPGAGTVWQIAIPELESLTPVLTPRDQTLSQFGFQGEELRQFAVNASAASFDRIVPVGRALQFGPYWDGFDLLSQFTRHVVLEGFS
jgi:hypothetical protein